MVTGDSPKGFVCSSSPRGITPLPSRCVIKYAANAIEIVDRAQMQEEFKLVFYVPDEREAWLANSVRNCLKKLVKEGLAEPCHDRSNTGLVGSWKWMGGPGTP